LESAITDRQACLVINPRVLKEWVGGDCLPPKLSSFLPSHFCHLFVHSVCDDLFDNNLVSSLSCGHLRGVQGIQPSGILYKVSSDSRDICEAFAGLSFGPANATNDRVFVGDESPATRRLISIGNDTFMAAAKNGNAEILFVGSGDVADLDVEAAGAWLTEYFSRLLPHVMALRHIFGEECWRPGEQHASIIVDDPLLRSNYGFLNFDKLLGLMRQHNFQTTIAFIPYNFRRSSPRIVKMFQDNGDRLALCFHGNDHTGAEFAATDEVVLNTMLRVAEERICAHTRKTGIACDRVMVFPQGQFSVEAMAALRSRNFDAAVNTITHPRHQDANLTLCEMAQPAVLRYAGFPLFPRRSSLNTLSADIAFNLFFGRPVLIVEHHNIFKDPQPLIDVVNRINAAAPGVRWSNLAAAVSNSFLRRREPDGTYRVRAYARTVRVANSSDVPERLLIEWNHPGGDAVAEKILRDGTPLSNFAANQAGMCASVDLDPGSAATFSIMHREGNAGLERFGIRHSTRVFMRRRLSEIRDNYLSKNPSILAAAKAVQRRIQR
jgi:hypothetical protein